MTVEELQVRITAQTTQIQQAIEDLKNQIDPLKAELKEELIKELQSK